MARKKYISLGSFPLSVTIPTKDGQFVTFDFLGGFRQPVYKPCNYVTSDEREQELLENSASYGKSFTLDESYNMVLPGSVEKPKQLILKEFASVNEAKEYFHSENQIAYNKIDTKDKIVKVGLSLGFTVEFKTDNKE